jgi:transcriptional regulator GlxA family with amidase domain
LDKATKGTVKPSTRTVARPTRLAFALVPGFLDVSLGVTTAIVQTVNALCRATGQREAFELSLVAPTRGTSLSAAGIKVRHQPLDVASDVDVLVVPGAFIEDAAAMHAWVTQSSMAPWLAMLRHRRAAARPVAASCAGTWLLAEAGMLDGRQATTVWWLAAAFRDRYPQILLDTQRMVVSDGPVTTAGAALAQTDLMLHLVARMASASLAERCARLLLADRREVQSRHISLSWMAEADPLMRRACGWIDRHLNDPVDVADLAQALHMTSRTLARRCKRVLGVSPWRLVQRRRIEAATELLRTTTLPFEKVAARVGYADPSALRTLIRRELGVAPSSLRSKAVGTA